MALIGNLATVRAQLANAGRFAPAFAFIEQCLTPGSPARLHLEGLAAETQERTELSDGLFALSTAYVTKSTNEAKWESHRLYIDIQAMIVGEELMEVSALNHLAVTEDLTPGRDVIFYGAFPHGSVFRMGPGEAAMFFPEDGHKPTVAVGAPALVRKVVVKVPVL
jgi:YhcH/YjgK/YiaL family protein